MAALRVNGLRLFGHDIAGMLGLRRLEKHDPAFLLSNRIMLDTPRHDMKIAALEMHMRAVAIFDGQRSLPDQEKLVLVAVGMPGELALNLGELDALAVEIGDDTG